MKKFLKYLLIIFLLLIAVVIGFVVENNLSKDPDATYELRGRYKASLDGKTYLVIEDDNGGNCGPLIVNKKKWPYALHQKGEVEFGVVTLECGSWIAVNVLEGTTYYFNYWGP